MGVAKLVRDEETSSNVIMFKDTLEFDLSSNNQVAQNLLCMGANLFHNSKLSSVFNIGFIFALTFAFFYLPAACHNR